MNREEILKQFPNASASFLARNLVARLGSSEPKQDQRGQIKDRGLGFSTQSFRLVVSIVTCRKRKLDEHDNLRGAHKPLVDHITRQLGFASDDDPRITWEYGQHVTRDRTGTLVAITMKEGK